VTDRTPPALGDPLTEPFWQAAASGELLVQRCRSCGHHQLYPRPHCLACESNGLSWHTSDRTGTAYSVTRVHLALAEDVSPPYPVALVELDEGPRVLAFADPTVAIGDRVHLRWQAAAHTPFPVLYAAVDR
jgi:uncharacterized OB-fold protein